MSEDEHLVHINEGVRPHRRHRLAVRIEFGLKVHIHERPALAVADPRLVDPHCHVAALGKLIQDAAVRLRSAQRFVDRP